MPLRKNILANYVGTGFVVLAPMLALPYYLHALGSSVWGLVGFIAALQAVLTMIDAGMSQTLVREFALRLDVGSGSKNATAALLFGFERIYWAFALIAGCIVALLASFIAKNWLNLGDLPIALGQQAVYGAAALFAVQFPGSVYRSLLVGAQAHVKLNGVLLSGAFLRHIGAIAVVTIWPTLMAYLIWHIAIAFLETLVRAKLAWGILSTKRSSIGWQIDELRPTWTIIASMSGAAFFGVLTVQMDKIILSRMVSIEQFGYYVIASTVATGLLQLIYPLLQASLPRAIHLRNQPANLYKLNIKLFKAIVFIAGLVIIGYVFIGKFVLITWLKNAQVAEVVYHLLAALLIGTLLNAFYNIGYINWIAHERVRIIFQVYVLSFVMTAILVPIFVVQFGTIGAAFGWIVINLIGFICSLGWIKRT